MSAAVANEVSGILGLLMFVGVALFLVLYIAFARWRDSALGRHMLYFMLAFAFVLAIRTASVFLPGITWLAYVRIVTYALLVLAIWQRVYLLVRALRSGEAS